MWGGGIETGWDLGPFAGTWDHLWQCCNACTWTHLSLSNRIQRNCIGLKITACVLSWDKFWTQKIQRDQETQLPLLKSLEQKQGVGSKSKVLRMPPAHTTTYGVGKHLSHPSGDTPTLTPYKEPACPCSGSEQTRESVVCSRSPLLQQGPNKALPEFLVWPPVNFYWLGKAKNAGR